MNSPGRQRSFGRPLSPGRAVRHRLPLEASRQVSTELYLERLAETANRQQKQIELEEKGTRKQHRPPSPRGSRPWLRAKAERDKKKAEVKAVEYKEQADMERQVQAVQQEAAATKAAIDHEAAETAAAQIAAEIKAAEIKAEAVAAAMDPTTSRGKWASADWTLVDAFLSSRGASPEMGGFETAQGLMYASKTWHAACLKWCEDIEELPLRGGDGWDSCTVGKGAMGQIARTAPKVRMLHLCGFNGIALSQLPLLAAGLEELTLTLCTEAGATLEANCFPRLRSLKLEACRDVSAEGLRQVATESRDLRSLCLDSCALGGAVLAFARNLPVMNGNLEHFSCDQYLTDESLRAFSRACPRIESVSLKSVATSVMIKQLGMHAENLRHLQLSGGEKLAGSILPWKDADVEALAKGCPRLAQLRLEHGAESPISGAYISDFHQLTDLSLAHLGSSRLCRRALMPLWQQQQTRVEVAQLTRLDLSGCALDDGGVLGDLLAGCIGLQHLELADVRCEAFPPDVFHEIRCTGLLHFGVSGTAIDSAGVILMVKACPELKSLDLRNTRISDLALSDIRDTVAPPKAPGAAPRESHVVA